MVKKRSQFLRRIIHNLGLVMVESWKAPEPSLFMYQIRSRTRSPWHLLLVFRFSNVGPEFALVVKGDTQYVCFGHFFRMPPGSGDAHLQSGKPGLQIKIDDSQGYTGKSCLNKTKQQQQQTKLPISSPPLGLGINSKIVEKNTFLVFVRFYLLQLFFYFTHRKG